jgi:hypothetical protein
MNRHLQPKQLTGVYGSQKESLKNYTSTSVLQKFKHLSWSLMLSLALLWQSDIVNNHKAQLSIFTQRS